MNNEFWNALPLVIGAVGLFSWLGVASWAEERRKEREAYYKSEAIKKVAEMQGQTSESVLQVLREALGPPPPPAPTLWWMPKQAAAYYKSEMLKEITRMPDSNAALEFLREQARNSAQRTRLGLRLGGLITIAVGIGLMPFLLLILPDMPVYLVGLIPLLVGVALLTSSYIFVPKS